MATIQDADFDYEIPVSKAKLCLDYDANWIKQVSAKWSRYDTFIGLLKNNAKFIKGRLPNTPSHMGALLDSDPKYISKLLELNKVGILSTDGQEFKQNITREYIFMQREYLTFAYKPNKNNLADIISRCNTADFYYCAISYDDCKVYQTPGLGRLGFDNPEFWVTRTYLRHTDELENETHMAEPCDILQSNSTYAYFCKDFYPGTIFFQIWSKTWDESPTYLLDRILAAFTGS